MGKLVTVSAKVSKELRRKVKELKINVSEVVRKALEEAVRKLELQRFLAEVEEELKRGPKLPKGTLTRLVRETRERS